MFKKRYVKQCQDSMYIFLVISESWKFVRFHEILYHKDAENFSFLSWRASARDFTVLYSSKVLPVKIYKLDSYLPIIRHWLPALHCAVWYIPTIHYRNVIQPSESCNANTRQIWKLRKKKERSVHCACYALLCSKQLSSWSQVSLDYLYSSSQLMAIAIYIILYMPSNYTTVDSGCKTAKYVFQFFSF